jgi:peptide-methionine (S)-S-oxide reductase
MSWFDDLISRMAGARSDMVTRESALPGRKTPLRISGLHEVNGNRTKPPFPANMSTAVLGEGCFWGAERGYWELDGVYSTAVGYAGGFTPNPTYEEVCSGRTGHAEVVLVVFDPQVVSYGAILKHFWESHDPTQGMRQGNDMGTQYRSAIYAVGEEQLAQAHASAEEFGRALGAAGFGKLTTEIGPLTSFYYAEEYHQQYLHKNPGGYCPVHATGVQCRS